MTQDEIIRMAREAGLEQVVAIDPKSGIQTVKCPPLEPLKRFAALVAAHERNRLAWTQEHWTEYEHAIAAAEREACAKVCDEFGEWRDTSGVDCAAAIRARGEK